MAPQIKIDQNNIQIDIKEQSLQRQSDKGIKEIKLKAKETVEIDTEKIVESAKPKINTKIKDNEELVVVKKDDEKSDNKGFNLTDEKLKEIKDATNKVLAEINIKLDFSYDKELNRMVVKVINKENGKVVRQIPPEEMLKIAKRMEEMVGVLMDKWS